jgi:hypothetical protein
MRFVTIEKTIEAHLKHNQVTFYVFELINGSENNAKLA